MKKIMTVMIAMTMGLALMASGPEWETDWEVARTRAEKENKPILVNFSGSDWCGWCKRLDREVFRTDEFKAFAEKGFVLLNLDFPKYKDQDPELRKQNQKLLNKYGVTGFPSVLVVNHTGKLVFTTGYMQGGAGPYIDHLKPYL